MFSVQVLFKACKNLGTKLSSNKALRKKYVFIARCLNPRLEFQRRCAADQQSFHDALYMVINHRVLFCYRNTFENLIEIVRDREVQTVA